MDESSHRKVIEIERTATIRSLELLTIEWDEIVSSSIDSNSDDEHDPEGSTIAFERAKLSSLIVAGREYLDELDRALERLDEGQPLACDTCGAPIALERLLAMPTTRRCVRCAITAQR